MFKATPNNIIKKKCGSVASLGDRRRAPTATFPFSDTTGNLSWWRIGARC